MTRKATFTDADLREVMRLDDDQLTKAAKFLQAKGHEVDEYTRVLANLRHEEQRARARFDEQVASLKKRNLYREAQATVSAYIEEQQ